MLLSRCMFAKLILLYVENYLLIGIVDLFPLNMLNALFQIVLGLLFLSTLVGGQLSQAVNGTP